MHTYGVARGLLLSESYSDETNNRTYVYKFLAMPVQISDDAGVRNFAYNSFNELETEEQCKLSCFVHPCLWLVTWDPTQPVATRPLAIQKDGTWYTYGWDLTKNICEVFGQNGYIRSTYAYTPFGAVTANGDVNQPIQWSSEYCDSELTLVYYNYRHYNPTDGRWINRDLIAEQGGRNLYGFEGNRIFVLDSLGFQCCKQEINYFSSNCFKQKRECGFLTPTGQVGCIDSTILTKIKKEIKRINNIKDKCNRRCYCVKMISEPINLDGLYAFSSYYDKIILLAHSRGYYNNYTILIDKDVFVHSSELPKNIEVLGCHLYGKLNKREKIEGGTKSNIVSILQILDDLLFRILNKYTAKENCEITYKIGLLTTTIKSYHIPNDVVKNPYTI